MKGIVNHIFLQNYPLPFTLVYVVIWRTISRHLFVGGWGLVLVLVFMVVRRFFCIFMYGRIRIIIACKKPVASHLDAASCTKPDYIKVSVPLNYSHFTNNPVALDNISCRTDFKCHVTIASYYCGQSRESEPT